MNKTGLVIEALPSLYFLIEFSDGSTKRCYLAGKLHKNFVRIIVGDKVEVMIPPTGDIGRIVRRLRM